MRQLTLTPPLMIITIGTPGAGKTYFARQFADQYKLPYVSEDRIRFELFERPLYNDDETEIIDRMTDAMLEPLLSTRLSVVVDGCATTARQQQRLNKLAQQSNYRVLFVWLQTDQNTSATRAASRDRRNLDNKYAHAIDRRTYDYLASILSRPPEKADTVVISGKHTYKSQQLTVLKKITTIYAQQLNESTAKPQIRVASEATSRRVIRRFVQ